MFEKSNATLEKLGAVITTREIQQEPKLWLETLAIYQQHQAKLTDLLASFELKENQKIRVIFTGAGTSQYVGDTLVPYLRRMGDTKRFEFVSLGTTDIVAAPKDYLLADEPTLLVSFARSGNSPESKATVKLANKVVKQVKHLVITCAAEGALAVTRKADANSLVVLMPELSNDKGFAMTGSFTCMTLAGLLFFDQTDQAKKIDYVKTAVKLGEYVIEQEDQLAALVALDFERIVYLGSGPLSGLAREAQLKILELTHGQIATVFDSSMGFRHGPKSFINEKTLVLGLVANDPYTRKYDLDVLEEVHADQIALQTVSIGQVSGHEFTGQRFDYPPSETLPEGYLALPDIMVAQVIALLTSLKIGNTPDTPSPSGTVNRVVKGVLIHEFE
ncbi:SIS domain-containing protein [Ligilactobacillus murinus]|uniref:SIS domain-containing protein n=1 Tax=Ligilactobacillus murinus TaxID=1622 RepID=UPI001071FCDF|nr:SIS domain-containing protein [Ligilactobacillus murinus]MBF0757472.1 SIS domain-containing protein [Ligilactobacillus murinus]MBF0833035.1 SIS domain-containing protein [Ligilactobacillus murinus]TFU66159.1 SIS domain-containing protein [Ligilactobacillus murinus]